ncbi:MAG: lysylphosphatidylglycerol synthase transmembrane domain-containing protein [Bacteroides sp.]|nr:lysylphosphatidylglycerol synthase transmembrane domain-containing protein [Bacteroides sp.]
MKKNLLQILRVVGFLSLGILLLYFAFRGIAFNKLAGILREANFWWVGLSMFFAILSLFSRARRWVLLIEPLGFTPSFKNTYHSLMIGYLSNFALPRLGEVTRCVTLGKREKIPVDSLIGTVIIERVTDLIMLLMIMVVLIFSWADKFGAFFNENIFVPMREKITATFGGMIFFWILVIGSIAAVLLLLYLFRKPLGKIRIVRKIASFLLGVLDGLKTIYKMKRKWEYLFHSVLIWFLYIMMTWVVVFALKETADLTFVDGIFLLVIGGLGMSAPVTAGFGAFHWIVSRGMVFVYGLTLEQGGAYAILAHESNSILLILLGALSYVALMLSRKKKPVAETSK